jgi:hypothetical protein
MDHTIFLSRLRARLRAVLIADGAARLTVIILLAVAALVGLDYAFHLPGWLRAGAMLVVVASVANVVRKRLWRPFTLAHDDRALAILAERRAPALAGRLATRVEGLSLGAADEAVLASTLQATTPGALVPGRKLPRNLAIAGGLVLAALVTALLMPWLAQDGLARLLLPFGGSEWRRLQGLTGELERGVVASDEKAVLTVTRHHGPASPVTLAWRRSGGGPGEERQLAGLDGPWRHALGLSAGDWTLTATSGDALPVDLPLRVLDRLAVTAIDAAITPPAYAKAPPVQQPTLAATALVGSQVSFTATVPLPASRSLTEAWLDLPGTGGPQRIALTVAGGTARGAFTIQSGGEAVLGGRDGDGLGIAPARFAIEAIGDRPPVADLTGPREGELVSARAEIRLTATGTDDLGLAQLAIERRIRPATGEGAPAADLTAWTDVAGRTTASRPTVLSLAGSAKSGDVVVLTARASDANDLSGPGIGRSRPLTLKVVDEDELRTDLARVAADAKERLSRAREDLAQGLGQDAKLAAAARAAGIAAEKAADLLATLERRWADNQLPADQVRPAAQAKALVAQALPQLTAAAAGAAQPAREADASLADAERMLAQLVQESDLGKTLASLIVREEALHAATRTMVKDYLVRPLDDEGRARRADLAKRQDELAEQVRELERKLLADGSAQLDAAKDVVRSRAPGDRLALAGRQVAGDDQRAKAVESQKDAIEALKKLQDLLRGDAAAKALADRVGELAYKEEIKQSELDSGRRPQELQAEQERLAADIERLKEDAAKAGPEAGKLAEAAAGQAKSAAQGMAAGDRAGASRDAGAAAALLRELQKGLQGQDQQAKDEKEKTGPQDVMAALKELHRQQSRVLVDAAGLNRTHGDGDLPFDAQRQAGGLGQSESDLALICQEEVTAKLDKFPLAKEAASRIQSALSKAAEHFIKPAAGRRGERLAATALNEIARMIDIVEAMPSPEGKGGDGGGDGQQGEKPPFPAEGELALLGAMQDEVGRLTAARRAADLLAGQTRVRDLVEGVLKTTRPGSRPGLLMLRAWRASAQATELLAVGELGATTRNEQELVVLHLRQLLAEAQSGKGDGDGKQGKNQKPRDPPKPDGGQPQPQPGGGAQPGGAAAGAAQAGAKAAGSGRVQVQGAQESGDLLHLPPERREQLRNAREQLKSARAQQLFERYLELLEDGR